MCVNVRDRNEINQKIPPQHVPRCSTKKQTFFSSLHYYCYTPILKSSMLAIRTWNRSVRRGRVIQIYEQISNSLGNARECDVINIPARHKHFFFIAIKIHNQRSHSAFCLFFHYFVCVAHTRTSNKIKIRKGREIY